MTNVKFIGLISLVGILIVGYGFLNTVMPENAAVKNENNMKGYILNISNAQQNNKEIIGSVLVDGTMDSDNQSTPVSFKITKKTEIFKQLNGENYLITFDELKTGQNVEITSTGPMLMSYPAQAGADKIVVLEK